jgi:outer membrane biosynthesis protein TonB
LLRGPLSIGGGGGLEAVNLDLGFYAIKLGFKARASTGRLAFTAMPAIFVAATKRDAMTPNTDLLYLPIGIGFRATQTATIALGSGIKGPVSHFADKWQIPVGANISFAIGHVVIGASWVFGALAGAAANPPAPAAPIKGPDLRVVQVWVAYSFGGKSKTKADVPVSFETATEPPQPAWIEVDARPTPTKPPTDGAKVELPKLGQIPQATIDSVAADHGAQLSKCEGVEELRGEVSIELVIDAAGKVTRAELKSSTVTEQRTPRPKVADCILRAVETWQFPKPASGASRGVYTISFQ